MCHFLSKFKVADKKAARKAAVVIKEISGTKEKSTLLWDNRKGVLWARPHPSKVPPYEYPNSSE